MEKKLEIEMVNSPHFLGYSKLGAEITALKPDHREQFDVSFRIIWHENACSSSNSLQQSFPRPAQMSPCIGIFVVPTRYVFRP